AFNRLEDVGLEVGVDLGRHFYLKGSLTAGNPVFLRDPNALAGDNGTSNLLRKNPDPVIKSGVVIPYDAAVQSLDEDGDLQKGGALGLRFASEDGETGLDALAFGRERKLAKTLDIRGSFYGGDLDLLDGPAGIDPAKVAFPVTSDRKREVGADLWLYRGGLSFFGQYVDQDLGGLGRIGYEGEFAWRFDLPLAASFGGRQLFPSIQPAVRYSKLTPDYKSPPQSPSPSFAWPWEKWDAGLRVAIVAGVDVTAEYSHNTFTLGSGAKRHNDELLATLRWQI